MKQLYLLCFLSFAAHATLAQAPMIEVPLDKKFKGATVLTFKPPYETMKVFIEDDLDSRYSTITTIPTTLFLKRSLGSRKPDKIKPEEKLAAADVRPGMRVDLRTDHYQRSLKNEAKEVVLAEDYYGNTNLKGLFEFIDGDKASVDGQLVMLNKDVVLKGMNEWKDKKFVAFSELQLGCELTLHGKRDTDGIIYVARGSARPVESSKEDRLLRRGVDLGLKVDKNRLSLGKNFTRVFITDNSMQDYVNGIGRKIVPEYLRSLPISHPDHIDFKYYLVEDETLNASAFPNGAVVIHTGIIKKIDNEAQLAAIIGHEIAHVTQKHHAKNYRHRQNWEAVSGVLEVAAAATVGGVPAVAVGLVSEMYVSKYSRDQETQADRIGLRYIYDAGYDAREAANIWKKLSQEEAGGEEDIKATAMMLQMMGEDKTAIPDEVPDPEKRESLYASHPRSRDRFNHVNFLLSTAYSNVDFSKATVNTEQHMKVVRALRGHVEKLPIEQKKPVKVSEKPPKKRQTGPKSTPQKIKV